MRRFPAWFRLFFVGAIVLAGAVAVLVWRERDRPRRLVERILENELGAEVRLDRLVVAGPDSFVLRGLRVVLVEGAWSVRVEVAHMQVRGSLAGMNRGSFESVEITGLEVRLRAAEERAPPAPEEDTAPIVVDRLSIDRGLVSIESADATATFGLAADLRGIGETPSGRVELRGRSVPLRPLLAAALGAEALADLERRSALRTESVCRALGARAALPGDGSATIEAGGDCDLALRDRSTRAPFPRVTVAIDPTDGSRALDLDLTAVSAGLVTARVHARYDVEDGTLAWRNASASVEDAGALVAIAGLAPDGLVLDARGDVEGRVEDDGAEVVDAVVTVRRVSTVIEGTTIEVGDGRIEIAARSRPGAPAPTFDVHGALRAGTVGVAAEGLRLPASMQPLGIAFEGTVLAGEAPRVSGGARLTTTPLAGLRLDGSLAVGPDGSATLDPLEVRPPRVPVETWLALLRDAGYELPIEGTFGGDVALFARLDGAVTAPTIRADATAGGLRADLSFDDGLRLAAADGRAVARLDGAVTSPSVHLDLSIGEVVAERTVEDDRGPASSVLGRATLDAIVEGRTTGNLRVSRLRVAGSAEVAGRPPLAVEIDASATIDARARRVALDPSTFALPGLLRAEVEGATSLEDFGGAATLRLVEADVPRIRERVAPTLDGTPLAGLAVSATPSLVAGASWRGNGAWIVSGTAGFEGVALEAAADRVLQGLDGAWNVYLTGFGPEVTGAAFDGHAGGFLVLWGPVLGDWSAAAPRAEVVAIAGPPGAWEVIGHLDLDERLRLHATGRLTGDALRFETSLVVEDIAAAYERHARTPLGASIPRIEKLYVGGRAAAIVRGEIGDGAWAASGALRIAEGSWTGEAEELGIHGLDVSLPFELEKPGADAPLGGGRREGRLAFDRIDLMGVELPGARTRLAIEGDAVRLAEPLAVRLYDGEVVLRELAILGIASGEARAESRVALHGLRLEPLSAALGLPPLEGAIDGTFPRVLVTPDRFEVDGGGEVQVFGGTVRFGGIAGESFFTSYPRLFFSTEFEDIDLTAMTRTFDFGEMSGVLRGHLRDCELFDWVPLRFEAHLETVPRKGIPQRITVKAVNNLAILGTGGKVGVFDRGIHKFIDRYSYRKLGIDATLDNDVFLLRGTERRGETELFLEGRFPFRIDIVNARPGRAVSFRAMRDRLGALDVSAATTGP